MAKVQDYAVNCFSLFNIEKGVPVKSRALTAPGDIKSGVDHKRPCARH